MPKSWAQTRQRLPIPALAAQRTTRSLRGKRLILRETRAPPKGRVSSTAIAPVPNHSFPPPPKLTGAHGPLTLPTLRILEASSGANALPCPDKSPLNPHCGFSAKTQSSLHGPGKFPRNPNPRAGSPLPPARPPRASGDPRFWRRPKTSERPNLSLSGQPAPPPGRGQVGQLTGIRETRSPRSLRVIPCARGSSVNTPSTQKA